MELENMSESVNSRETLSLTVETACVQKLEAEATDISRMRNDRNAEAIGSNKNGIVNNVDAFINDQNSPFHSEIDEMKPTDSDQELSYKTKQPQHKSNTSNSNHYSKIEEECNEIVGSPVTDRAVISNDSLESLEYLNGNRDSKSKLSDDPVTDKERILDPKETIQKATQSPVSCDSLQHPNDNSESKAKLVSVAVEQEQIGKISVIDVENSHSCSHDTRRSRRNSKRRRVDVEECCPVCGVTVRLPELENHFAKEVENLSKIPKTLKKFPNAKKEMSTTFIQVKSNRVNRMSDKVARYTPSNRLQFECPVCHLKMKATTVEMNKHVLNCMEEEDPDEMVFVDIESFEEYEFADQTRVRAISLVPGGYKSLQGQSSSKRTSDEDEDVDVDVDDTMTYGEPQYTEMDIIHTKEDKDLELLRKAVLCDPTTQPQVLDVRKWSNNDYDESENFERKISENCDDTNALNKSEISEQMENFRTEQSSYIVSSLKEKIRDLEEQNKNVKCLICLEPYAKPVVSTTCWHVHCEECWLMTMGVKKLCPQCNMIVFPSDLRRIYL